MMPYQRQTGFTLVELMVAMAIGTIIILGAGQLFLTTFQTFQKVDELSRKQESLIFITGVLIHDLRAGRNIRVDIADAPAFQVSVLPSLDDDCDSDDFLQKRYFLSESNGKFSLSTRVKCENNINWRSSQPLVEGFYDDSEDSFEVIDLSGGLYQLTIRLNADNDVGYEEFVFRIQNRSSAV